ncbi:PIG-L deacetylase family protein [uncultured Jatrophihabitans sp.]|uniref:PIG-L deacetylase family protein n=1 Tax=uncultured Jatrophihabitans sp. TaxID=1610747 RepID=UPI0035CB24BC
MTAASARLDLLAGVPYPPSNPNSGLVEVRSWPRRTALVLGGQPSAAVMDALRRFGFSTAVTGIAGSERVAGLAAPFGFLVISPDVFADDASVELVRGLHEYSPSARVILEYPREGRDADVVLRALRAGVVDVIDAQEPFAIEQTLEAGLDLLGRHRERVLAIGAHPDDVEIGCAGTLLDHRLRGDRLTIMTLSRGAVGGDQQQRMEEATAAAEAIGAQLIFADLPDTLVDDGITTIKAIEEVVKAINPTVVYSHSARDNHQDHRAVSTATASATRQVRRVYAYQSPSATNEYRPTRFVPIDHVLQRKVQVLMMFDSQNGRNYLEPELVVAGSRYWARQLAANARYAEPFEVIRSVGDLRQSSGVGKPAVSDLPEFGLPAYETRTSFERRAVALA